MTDPEKWKAWARALVCEPTSVRGTAGWMLMQQRVAAALAEAYARGREDGAKVAVDGS